MMIRRLIKMEVEILEKVWWCSKFSDLTICTCTVHYRYQTERLL